MFDWMPFTALVSDRILCMHGGISPRLEALQQLRLTHLECAHHECVFRDIKRPCDPRDDSLEKDLLWSDPVEEISGFAVSCQTP